MGFRFQKSIKLGGGVRLNISKSGLGASIGTKGLRVGTGPRGTRITTNIPGTGIGYTKTFGNKRNRKNIDFEYKEEIQPDIFTIFAILIIIIAIVLRLVFSNLIFNIYLVISMTVLSILLYEIKTSTIEVNKEFEVNNLKSSIYIALILMGIVSYFSSQSSLGIFCIISILRINIIFYRKKFIKNKSIEKKETVEFDNSKKLETKEIDIRGEILKIIRDFGLEGILQKDLCSILLKQNIEISKNKLYSEVNELESMGDIKKIKEGRSYRLKIVN
ncbi:Protein of unknown function [Cetobacterium ceti]|uniref:DUF4236 domain-containing protein n=1 Tax=Cetobacterium ceti TaxID=180163 RepID=A0A1T4PVK5_9FUSO|nr:DUF4236 domain-containing protein [Cetobacterium ceti]SJZ95594.1 Protein of unknown function [Cetobacterium ceti]